MSSKDSRGIRQLGPTTSRGDDLQQVTPGDGQLEAVLSWHRTSGWAHLSSRRRGSPDLPRFVKFPYLPFPTSAVLRQVLAVAGYALLSEHDTDGQLTEFHFAATKAAMS